MTTGSTRHLDVFSQAENTAHEWLQTAVRHLATEDPHHAYRVVRAWLHAVRDRLSVDVSVHFAAQLPLVWRGLFYDGWTPQRVPVKYDAEQFLTRVAHDADVSVGEARKAVAAVTDALTELTSPDQLGHVLAALPADLRKVLQPAERRPHPAAEQKHSTAPRPRTPAGTEAAERPVDARLADLERDVQIVADALGALVEALDERPSSEPEPARYSGGARRAHQILLTRMGAGTSP
jgi:uncharacterized protein (DUF2267 family)